MAQHGAYHHGDQEITDQKATFHGFLITTVWMCAQIAMGVALATLAFAIGAGWWAGLAAFLVIGVAAGMLFKLSGVWWATLIVEIVLLGLGGLIVPAISAAAG